MTRRHNLLANITRADLEPVWSRPEIPISRIAEALGVSFNAVRLKAERLGLPARKTNLRRARCGNDDLLRKLWIGGVRAEEIAPLVGYSNASSVRKRAVALGLEKRVRAPGSVGRGGWGTKSLLAYQEEELARLLPPAAAATKEAYRKRLYNGAPFPRVMIGHGSRQRRPEVAERVELVVELARENPDIRPRDIVAKLRCSPNSAKHAIMLARVDGLM